MGTLIAFVLERIAVSLPDILIGGLGGYLLAGRRRIGVGILALYGLAIAGTFIGQDTKPNLVGPILGLIAAILTAWLGFRRRQARRSSPSLQ